MKAIISVLAGSILLASAVSANELIVTTENSASGQAAALDFSSDGNASALQMRFSVANTDKATVDLTKCVSDLPKSHSGECRFEGGKLTVVVYSDSNATFPKGLVSIGTVSISKSAGPLTMTELLAFDASASKISVKSQGDQGVDTSRAK